eukprot:GEMP01059591.1.p1 GENE.GEMP01059591.1~~GEMP01059591.1.p1  ORF type:complete len:437 (-),score=-4.07 GEMP01059591.1:133-1380(-)
MESDKHVDNESMLSPTIRFPTLIGDSHGHSPIVNDSHVSDGEVGTDGLFDVGVTVNHYYANDGEGNALSIPGKSVTINHYHHQVTDGETKPVVGESVVISYEKELDDTMSKQLMGESVSFVHHNNENGDIYVNPVLSDFMNVSYSNPNGKADLFVNPIIAENIKIKDAFSQTEDVLRNCAVMRLRQIINLLPENISEQFMSQNVFNFDHYLATQLGSLPGGSLSDVIINQVTRHLVKEILQNHAQHITDVSDERELETYLTYIISTTLEHSTLPAMAPYCKGLDISSKLRYEQLYRLLAGKSGNQRFNQILSRLASQSPGADTNEDFEEMVTKLKDIPNIELPAEIQKRLRMMPPGKLPTDLAEDIARYLSELLLNNETEQQLSKLRGNYHSNVQDAVSNYILNRLQTPHMVTVV